MGNPFENIRALIVDDNPVERSVLKAHLEKMGISNIQEAPNGNAGLFRIENAHKIGKPVHLLVTDWRMPERDGLKLVKTLRSSEGVKNMAIVMVTAVFEMEKVSEAISHKVDAYLIKPTEFEAFQERVSQAIEKRGLHKAA